MIIYATLIANSFFKKATITLALLGIIVIALSQGDATAIVQQFDHYRKNTLQEKMFVHTDKNFYLAGEICWFKIYAVDAFFHRPLDVSKVAYTELVDKDNKPVLQAKIALEKGTGSGSLYMPVTIRSGTYQLRVYSNWMKNFSADYFFQKKVTIINTQQVTDFSGSRPGASYDVQFFPEGGNLVNTLPGKIAFRVVDQYGKGVDCSGILVNAQNKTMQEFHTLKFGMGNFNLTPLAGQHYTAVVTMPGGFKITKELPAAFNTGYVMSLADSGEKIKISVHGAGDDAIKTAATVYLFAHTRNSIKAILSATIQNGETVFLIDKDKLGDGISQFTLFSGEKQPVCERLYFKYPAKQLSVKIRPDANTYTLRQKINLALVSADENGNPLDADMSMSVFRVDSLQSPANAGIKEYLYLCSDLPGTIESPRYYFDTTETQRVEAMENLVLTNGWRRFKWEDILQSKTPFFQFTPEHNGHVIKGKVINNKTGLAAANINSFLSVPGTTRFRTSLSDEKGQVKFEVKDFYGTPGIIVQTNAGKDSGYHIEIDNPFADKYATGPLPAFAMPSKNPATLLEQSIGMQVENIYHGDTIKKFDAGAIDTGSFYQRPNAIYLLDNYVRFTTMEEVLREYVFPVNVRKRGGRFHLPVFNDADNFNGSFDRDPLVLLDGVPVFDMDKVISYDPLKVRKLESVTRRYYYGQSTFDGIVSLVTYNGDLEGYELDPHATVIDYEALQLQREFYSPVYETAEKEAGHTPDFRNVLKWEPAIKTGKNGRYTTSFYSSDLPGKYVVIVQGLTDTGLAGSASIFFEVKKPVK